MLTEVLAWVADEVAFFFRAHAAGSWFGLLFPRLPVVAVHTSLLGWSISAACALALVMRYADWRAAAIALLFVAPLGFGTIRAKIQRWSAPRVTRNVAFVPACERDGYGDVSLDGRWFVLNESERFAWTGARARWEPSSSSIILFAADDQELALAKHTATVERRLGTRCAFDALMVDGEARSVAQMQTTILWGSLELTDPDGTRMRRLYDDLTRSQ